MKKVFSKREMLEFEEMERKIKFSLAIFEKTSEERFLMLRSAYMSFVDFVDKIKTVDKDQK